MGDVEVYTYHDKVKGTVWLGMQMYWGVTAIEYPIEEWRRWLMREYEKVRPPDFPSSVKKEFKLG